MYWVPAICKEVFRKPIGVAMANEGNKNHTLQRRGFAEHILHCWQHEGAREAPQALLGGHHFLQVSKAKQLNEWNSNFPRDNQIPKVMLIVSTLQSYWKTYLHQKLWNKSQRREPEHKPSQKVRKCSATPKKNQQYLRDRKQQCIESCRTSRTRLRTGYRQCKLNSSFVILPERVGHPKTSISFPPSKPLEAFKQNASVSNTHHPPPKQNLPPQRTSFNFQRVAGFWGPGRKQGDKQQKPLHSVPKLGKIRKNSAPPKKNGKSMSKS